MTKILLALLFFAACIPEADLEKTLFVRWFIVLMFSAVLFCRYFIYPRIGLVASLTTFYFIRSGAFVWELIQNQYTKADDINRLWLKLYAADSVAKLLIIITPLIYLCHEKEFKNWGMYAALAFSIANCMYVIGYSFAINPLHCTIHNSCFGILGNPSMNESMMVVVLPILAGFISLPYWLLLFSATFLTAVLAKSSLAIGMLALIGAFYLRKHWRFLPLCLFPLAIGAWYKGAEFFYSRGRFPAFNFFMGHWFSNKANWIQGTGFGTFAPFAHSLQVDYKWMDFQTWLWIHNDWAEIAFVGGFLGLALCAATYSVALYNLMKRKELHFALSLFLYSITMMFNYPTHLALSSLFGAWLMIYALRGDHGMARGC